MDLGRAEKRQPLGIATKKLSCGAFGTFQEKSRWRFDNTNSKLCKFLHFYGSHSTVSLVHLFEALKTSGAPITRCPVLPIRCLQPDLEESHPKAGFQIEYGTYRVPT